LIYLEISDQFTADEALNNFEGDFDSIDGYDKNFYCSFSLNEFALFLLLV